MIVLDTNVISAMVQANEIPVVTRWLDGEDAARIHTTAVTIHELRFGVERLPRGRRRTSLDADLDRVLSVLADRVLPLDRATAQVSSRLQAERENAGQPMDLADCLIAGIVAHHKAILATRNTHHFRGLPFTIVNPWHAAP